MMKKIISMLLTAALLLAVLAVPTGAASMTADELREYLYSHSEEENYWILDAYHHYPEVYSEEEQAVIREYIEYIEKIEADAAAIRLKRAAFSYLLSNYCGMYSAYFYDDAAYGKLYDIFSKYGYMDDEYNVEALKDYVRARHQSYIETTNIWGYHTDDFQKSLTDIYEMRRVLGADHVGVSVKDGNIYVGKIMTGSRTKKYEAAEAHVAEIANVETSGYQFEVPYKPEEVCDTSMHFTTGAIRYAYTNKLDSDKPVLIVKENQQEYVDAKFYFPESFSGKTWDSITCFDIFPITEKGINYAYTNVEMKCTEILDAEWGFSYDERGLDSGANEATPASFSVSFTDVSENDWFYEYVSWAEESDIAHGTGNGKFEPNRECTVAEALTLLYNMQKHTWVRQDWGGTNPYDYAKQEDWYFQTVLWATNGGSSSNGPLIYDGENIKMTDPCTRLQFIDFIVRINYYRVFPEIVKTFSDLDENDPRSRSANIAYNDGLVSGIGDNKFNPYGICTRAEIVTMLYNCVYR